ncbi:hypothetical protein TNIN_96511 [Trichonephila inaurata madagascariensis]|uniref:Uncharacterized protein n=1 Tax=Trichonephila inaurata madagascariensis TaxID=2747483 RepID=A0A8X6XWK2_9ARAC|nr:hypothetical protein TNIN_96511 [Trichonephila inaurata madagascariensis]
MLTPEVRRFKRGVPSSLEENLDKKRRPSNRNSHKRRLPSSTSSNQQAKKRGRRTEENNGQIPAGGSRPGPAEESPLQSSRIQQGRSSPYYLRNREQTRRPFTTSTGNSASQAGTSPVQKIKSIQFATPSTVQTRWPDS